MNGENLSGSTAPKGLIDSCKMLREQLDYTEKSILNLNKNKDFENANPLDYEKIKEAAANITLAYRHVEDARMRLGKVIQAMDGGVSIYDKPKE